MPSDPPSSAWLPNEAAEPVLRLDIVVDLTQVRRSCSGCDEINVSDLGGILPSRPVRLGCPQRARRAFARNQPDACHLGDHLSLDDQLVCVDRQLGVVADVQSDMAPPSHGYRDQ